MTYKEINETIKKIKMSEETKNRIIGNCYKQIEKTENRDMKIVSRGISLKKVLPLVAVIVLCITIAVVSVANQNRGFKDVKKGTAVVGSIYEESPHMIQIDAVAGETLLVNVSVTEFEKPPYRVIDTFDIKTYKILDMTNQIKQEGSAKSITLFENGNATFEIPIDHIENGKYRLVINEFVGSSKADQPLPVVGKWECSFTK